MRILIVEDDETLGEGLSETLQLSGHRVDWLTDGETALQAFAADDFEAVVLDLALPGQSGHKVLSHWRASGSTVPVLILTAHAAMHDCIELLDAGADDYIVKPARAAEIEARLRALARRRAGRADENLRYGALTLCISSRSAAIGERPVELSAYEFVVLQTLVERGGNPVTREQLESRLYGWSDGPQSNSLEVLIHRLRHKLGAEVIATVRNVGYRIAA